MTKTTKNNKANAEKKKNWFRLQYNKGAALLQRFGVVVAALLELFVVASIVYMAAVIYLGTDGLEIKLATAPAVLWAALKTVKQFLK